MSTTTYRLPSFPVASYLLEVVELVPAEWTSITLPVCVCVRGVCGVLCVCVCVCMCVSVRACVFIHWLRAALT